MCKELRAVAAAVALLLSAAGRVTAQGGSSVRIRAQEHLVDSLVLRHHAALAALKVYDDSVTRAAMRFDSVVIGNLHIIIDPGIRERAERAARVASAKIDSLAGSAAGRLSSLWIVIRAARNDTLRDTVVVAIRDNRHDHFPHVQEYQPVWGTPTDSALAQWVYQTAVTVLTMSVDAPMLRWLFGQMSPDTVTTSEWLGTRLEIVSSPASVAHRCYDGDLAACRVSLRLVNAGDVVTEWFDAASRRRYVERWRSLDRGQRYGDTYLCIDGNDAPCITVMRKFEHMADPIPPHRRVSVVKTAMRMAGNRGFERFLIATGSPAERLAATAGVPLDSVLTVWLRTVHEARRPSQDMSPSIAVSSLGWMLVCGVLALRSSRWR